MGIVEKKTLFRLILFTISIFLIVFVTNKTILSGIILPNTPFVIVYFFAVTFFFLLVMFKKHKEDHSKFLQGFMFATMLKLLLLMSVMVLFAFINKAEAKIFILTYFVLYVLFTIFEVITLNNHTKSSQKGNVDKS